MPAETHVHQDPLSRQAVLEIVRDVLSDILSVDPGSITEGQSFVDDLGAESMELIELVDRLEQEFAERSIGLRFADEDLEDLKTVRDAVDYVHGHVSAAG